MSKVPFSEVGSNRIAAIVRQAVLATVAPASAEGYNRGFGFWCISGYLGRADAFCVSTLSSMRVPSPIRPAATSHGADIHDRKRTIPRRAKG